MSTGDEYWELKVAGPLQNNTWSNIAIRWEQPGADDGTLDEKTGGLEVSEGECVAEAACVVLKVRLTAMVRNVGGGVKGVMPLAQVKQQ